MLAAFIEGFLEILVEKLPEIEAVIGQQAYLAECERIGNVLANATLRVQSMRQRLGDLMAQNDKRVDDAAKPPTGEGGK